MERNKTTEMRIEIGQMDVPEWYIHDLTGCSLNRQRLARAIARWIGPAGYVAESIGRLKKISLEFDFDPDIRFGSCPLEPDTETNVIKLTVFATVAVE
ncbi:MAG: hypothetical protein KatS3mg104_2947 [Phycisphaerae bacterium]|nr:MAG: hypothetical protein KatS3mg104_2947 [Phycisphaerae bacterium]